MGGIRIPFAGSRIAGIALLLAAEFCRAQGTPAPVLACPKPAPAPAPAKPAPSCLVPAKTVLQRREKGKAVLVDVRDAEAFGRYRIPGSLNIPLRAVKAKPFLRAEPVVLVDAGRTVAPLEQACAALKAAGFSNVSALRDGLRGWRAAKGPLEGDARTAAELSRLMPAELFAERTRDDWLVLAFTRDPKPPLRCWLPPRTEVVTGAGDAAVRAIKAAVARGPRLRVVAAGETAADRAAVAALLAKAGVTDAMILEGGLAGYREIVSNQLEIWGRQAPAKATSCCG